jgi:hypothetical protein
MWIVDDSGQLFNLDHCERISYENKNIYLWLIDGNFAFFLDLDLSQEERLDRYHDLIEKLTGERIDG